MKSVLEVRKGDYIFDFGYVTNIKVFTQNVAAELSSDCDEDANYARRVAAELDSCYKQVPDRIVISNGYAQRSFLPDALVNVLSTPVILKQAA